MILCDQNSVSQKWISDALKKRQTGVETTQSHAGDPNTIMNRKKMIIMKMIVWWVINIVWLLIFAVGAIFIGVRNVDSAGVVQTPEIRMISFIILGILFVIVVLIQLILLYFFRKKTTR